MQSIINKETGSLYITDDFSVNSKTTLEELKTYFGLDRLEVEPAYKTYENATLYDLKISDWYFVMTFYYNAGRLTHISFYPRDEEVNTASWDNFNPEADRDYYTNWMAAQLGDTKKFKWDLNQAGRHYSFSYPWGDIGVYYDFKGGTYSCIMGFKQK
ncbi:MAG: hypothetical protein EOO42_19860 [Flavobacteriales bacterium]|nr:MAG: hypothetical protein EOO42_19860 [Flavobacteriales bacterium]